VQGEQFDPVTALNNGASERTLVEGFKVGRATVADSRWSVPRHCEANNGSTVASHRKFAIERTRQRFVHCVFQW
jgi:hypothetical protein